MPKLQKFKKDNKKITTKNMIVSLSIIMCLLIVVVITKSYAIYKMQKEFDVIKNQIGNYSMGDVRVAVLVDGKETDTFPSYETNYKVESIECSNGVTATFDTINWQINIADMSATSTKCTVSFNSKETNETTPISYTKEELIALNGEYKNVAYENLKTQLLNDTYPVGSIYMSTEDDTVEKVQDKFGGTWVKYSSGTTLVGDDGTNYITNDSSKGSGGSSTVTLSIANIPSHNHSFTPKGSVSSSFSGSSVTTSSTNTNHSHSFSGSTSGNGITNTTYFLYYGGTAGQVVGTYDVIAGNNSSPPFSSVSAGSTNVKGAALAHYHNFSGTTGTMSANASHSHTVTTSGSVSSNFSGTAGTTGSTGSGSSFNIQNPYTVVYMYKRTA